MSNFEITRLCAEAMGFLRSDDIREQGGFYLREFNYPNTRYDPLHDDAQAMALVKKLGLTIGHDSRLPQRTWRVFHSTGLDDSYSKDLNRAICECVARMTLAGKE